MQEFITCHQKASYAVSGGLLPTPLHIFLNQVLCQSTPIEVSLRLLKALVKARHDLSYVSYNPQSGLLNLKASFIRVVKTQKVVVRMDKTLATPTDLDCVT